MYDCSNFQQILDINKEKLKKLSLYFLNHFDEDLEFCSL